MALNRIDLGTQCTIRETGEKGIIKKIYFYPTKYEIEFSNGKIKHCATQDLDIDGLERPVIKKIVSDIPNNGIGNQWTNWVPFEGESCIRHHFATSKEIMWRMLTSLQIYNVWFYGIQRALPVSDALRYVHRFSFTNFNLKPGSYFKIRPSTIAPYFKCRIMTFDLEKEFGFTFKTSPFYSEYIRFSIEETEQGVWVTCKRNSKGLFSILSQYNWSAKSQILQNLDTIIPKVEFGIEDQPTDVNKTVNEFDGFSTKQNYIDFAINMGMEGNMDYINSIHQKPIRGMAKAGVVKAKRTGVIPPKPEKSIEQSGASSSSSGLAAFSHSEMVAYLVNKGLDGDMDTVNAHQNKVIRGKAKAMILKIERGAIDRPSIPAIPDPTSLLNDESETEEQLMKRLISAGLEGNMDAINALENKVLRGKIKAAILKAKRAKN